MQNRDQPIKRLPSPGSVWKYSSSSKNLTPIIMQQNMDQPRKRLIVFTWKCLEVFFLVRKPNPNHDAK
jgi:hypothetical protein